MGNTTSSRDKHDESVDFGALVPFGVYSAQQDWNQPIVTQLIIDRKLAPFYRPLEDYDESWDEDQVLSSRKELPPLDPSQSPVSTGGDSGPPSAAPSVSHSAHSSLSKFSKYHTKTQQQNEMPRFSEAAIYKGATECPICLLYYPPNINRSRCCDQAICTECFVQIKRAEPTTTHIVSEPAACPYCVRDNFGVVYTPPPWRAGIGAEAFSTSSSRPELAKVNSASSSGEPESSTRRGKRKSYSHTSPEVVTTDQIRPDWEAKLAAVRAAVTRRANRRIIMRQVGDRLIPVGVTSGRVHANIPGSSQLADAGAVIVTDSGNPIDGQGRREGRFRRAQNQDLSQLLGGLTIGGQDLEELMVMEAMRLSLLEHEEQQRREREGARRDESAQNPSASPIAVPSPRQSSPSHRSSSHHGSPLRGLTNSSPANRSSVISSALGPSALSGALAIGLPPPHLGDRSSQASRQDTPQVIHPDLPNTPDVVHTAAPLPSTATEPMSGSILSVVNSDVATPQSSADDEVYERLLSNPPTSASDSIPLLSPGKASPNTSAEVGDIQFKPPFDPSAHAE